MASRSQFGLPVDEEMDDTTETTAEAAPELGEEPTVVGFLAQDDRFTTLVTADELETITGALIPVSIDGDTVMVGEATVTEADVEVVNGVIHVIDGVLFPPVE